MFHILNGWDLNTDDMQKIDTQQLCILVNTKLTIKGSEKGPCSHLCHTTIIEQTF